MESRCSISVIILTFNEELNLPTSLGSVAVWADQVFIVDSFSNDRTLEVAKKFGVEIHQNSWSDWAIQRNWALDNLPIRNQWVLFLDADERVSTELANEIREALKNVPDEVSGFYINRRFIFLGKELKHGGYNQNWVLRLVRHHKTRVLPAGDSEYFKVEGNVLRLKSFIIHEDVKALSFFIDKHNKISELAAKKLFHKEKVSTEDTEKRYALEGKHRVWLKENLLNKLPLFLRPLFLFVYKYFFKLGFLDGEAGFIYCFLHDFWYPFLVDAKVFELKKQGKKFDLEAERKYSLSEIPKLPNVTPADKVDSLMRWCTGNSNWSELLTDKKILEVGAGECSFVLRFLEVSKPKRYVATDLFLERMQVARKSINNPIIEFREGNILSLPFDENEFDLVLAFGIFHHVPNLEDAVTEIARVLKIGGGLIFRDPWVGNPAIWLKYRLGQKSKNEFPISGKQIKSVFKKNGFGLIHLSTFWLRFPFLPPGPWSVNIGGFFELVKKDPPK